MQISYASCTIQVPIRVVKGMFKDIYTRRFYLDKIRGFYKSDLIKVITGIRRCGKSCFLKSVMNDLEAQGIAPEDIIYIDLDRHGFKSIKTADALETVITKQITDTSYKYIFIDEIQNVQDFETVINAFREEGSCSIFITGSNSYLLSGELVTKLTGRYIEIELFTLNFHEYLEMKHFLGKQTGNIMAEFTEYINNGGFPKTLEFDSVADRELYLDSIIQQIIHRDIKQRCKIRNRSVFEKLMYYLFNNFGAPVSLTNILNYFNKQEKIAIQPETVNRYMEILKNAKLLYKCPRFDTKSKKALHFEQKYYLADLSICYANNVDHRINYGPVLENVLYTYLRSKGYLLSTGKVGQLECDFIARKNTEYCYIQVSMSIADKTVEDREYRPFTAIKDNYPKYLFTLDPLLQKRDGIIHKNLADFLASDSEL